jgi:Mn-dependent DtxR family transcriptional regulator
VNHPHYAANQLILDLLREEGPTQANTVAAMLELQLRAAVADLVEDGLVSIDHHRRACLTEKGARAARR